MKKKITIALTLSFTGIMFACMIGSALITSESTSKTGNAFKNFQVSSGSDLYVTGNNLSASRGDFNFVNQSHNDTNAALKFLTLPEVTIFVKKDRKLEQPLLQVNDPEDNIRGEIIPEIVLDNDFLCLAVIDGGKHIIEEKKEQDDNSIFNKVEIEASFPGGEAKWCQYLERNCNSRVATDNGAPEGTYTTMVQFVVDKEGNISNAQALSNHGYGMEQEAIRSIHTGPKWNPAIQNGRQVNACRRQLITFRVHGG